MAHFAIRVTSLCAFLLLTHCAFGDDAENPEEAKSFAAIKSSLSKTRIGDNPTELDLIARRVAAIEAASNAKQFLKSFPTSKRAGEADAILNVALSQAAIGGDRESAQELDQKSRDTIASPSASDELKQQVFVLNYVAQSAFARGDRAYRDSSPEGRALFCEALIGAADALPNKRQNLQNALLLLRSESSLNDSLRRDFARRVFDHPAANELLKATAKDILNGVPPYEINKPFTLKFTAVDGREVDLSKLKGKVVLIDFWATWCGPCVAEIPNLKKTYEKFHDQGLEIIGISLDDSKDELLKFLEKNGPMPWPQYFDGKVWNNEISFRFAISGVPTTFLIDKQGILRSTNLGNTPDGLIAVESFLKSSEDQRAEKRNP